MTKRRKQKKETSDFGELFPKNPEMRCRDAKGRFATPEMPFRERWMSAENTGTATSGRNRDFDKKENEPHFYVLLSRKPIYNYYG